MARTAAERMARTRARRKGITLEEGPCCTVCGKPLKNSGYGRAFELGLCFEHWRESDEYKKFKAEKRRRLRNEDKGPIPFRYFGCLPGQDNLPDGPYNRMRLAVSATYVGKNKPRGKLFIVWSDNVVTEHSDVTQQDVGQVSRETGIVVDRYDLYLMAKELPKLTERTSHYGFPDYYLSPDW